MDRWILGAALIAIWAAIIIKILRSGLNALERTLTLGMVVGLPSYLIVSEVAYWRRVQPTGISTIADFYERFGEPTGARQFESEGTTFIEVWGPLPSGWMLAFPSTAPKYVFDGSGRFVRWYPPSN